MLKKLWFWTECALLIPVIIFMACVVTLLTWGHMGAIEEEWPDE